MWKVFLIPLFFISSLHAWTEAVPGHFAFQGEALYMAPSFDETFFVLRGSGVNGEATVAPDGKRINHSIGYNSGWRIEGIWGFCNSCCDVRLRWTHLFAKGRKSVSNPDLPAELWPTYTVPGSQALSIASPFAGFASSSINLMYQKAELLLNERGWNLCGCHFTLRQGVEWSYLRYHEIVTYASSTQSQRLLFHGHTKGLGPQLGLIILYEPCIHCGFFPRNLGVKFLTSASLLGANAKSKSKSFDVFGVETHVSQQSFWRFVPELCYSFGFTYHGCCWRPINLEVGYEVTTYLRGISRLLFQQGPSQGASFNQYSDFFVHGLSFSAGIIF